MPLQSFQRDFLRKLAHPLSPVVYVGKEGLSDTLVGAIGKAIAARELIKVKFNDHKDKKREIMEQVVERTGAELVGIVGHVATLYREHADPDRRKIHLPER
jgi:RNA-binding protein